MLEEIPLKKPTPAILGSFTDNNTIFLQILSEDQETDLIESPDGSNFERSQDPPPTTKHRLLQVDSLDKGRFALVNLEKIGLGISFLKNHQTWSSVRKIELTEKSIETNSNKNSIFMSGAIVPHFQLNSSYVMFLGGAQIKMATSQDAVHWSLENSQYIDLVANPDEEIHIDLVKKIERGILLCYRRISFIKKSPVHRVHMALLDSKNPLHVIWQSQDSLWESRPEKGRVEFGGAVLYRSQLYSFWNSSENGAIRIQHNLDELPFQITKDHVIALERAPRNPIIHPRSEFYWESFATYNPAAFAAGGRVHILYRAQGPDLISSIGYASSKDGVNIDERLESPVYVPQEVFESFQRNCPEDVERKYVSGGGIAGCEDPRVTLIDERLYMTYVAFDGANPPRAALTSIHLNDFLAKRWNWDKPVLISQPGIINKSAVIFPEKIKNKYVIMHRIFPHIQIDYVDDLNFDGSRWLQEIDRISIRENMWDSRKIGAGAPPIKTPEGWLLIYYGVDDRDDRHYKMGAMLLDLEDPTKVLYRSSTPILEPEDWYENSGFKPGIVYPCGAVELNETLHVYYGGADCVVCVASRNLDSFLKALKSNHELQFANQNIHKVGSYATHKTPLKFHSGTQYEQ